MRVLSPAVKSTELQNQYNTYKGYDRDNLGVLKCRLWIVYIFNSFEVMCMCGIIHDFFNIASLI